MKINELTNSIEAMLFASGEPVSTARLAQALDIDADTVDRLCADLMSVYNERGGGLKIVRLENRYQLCTRSEYADMIRALMEIKRNQPLSRAAFEVLAIIAYNQPVTKSFMEQVRGVDCSGVVNSLVSKGLVEERGRMELPGRPLLYGTTDLFLRCFNMSGLDDLPSLPDDSEQLPEQTDLFEGTEQA